MLCIIYKFEILTGRLGNRRIRGGTYIADNHGVIVTLRHIQLG